MNRGASGKDVSVRRGLRACAVVRTATSIELYQVAPVCGRDAECAGDAGVDAYRGRDGRGRHALGRSKMIF
jgi:hypothetical protein